MNALAAIAKPPTAADHPERQYLGLLADILANGDPYYNPGLSLGVQGGFHADPYYAEELPR